MAQLAAELILTDSLTTSLISRSSPYSKTEDEKLALLSDFFSPNASFYELVKAKQSETLPQLHESRQIEADSGTIRAT